jgi:hypothetical protein
MNPFELVYSALWDLLLQHPHFQTVKAGNKIRFDMKHDSAPLKPKLIAADLPELMLLIDATTANLRNTSNSSMCIRTFSWQVSSGDFRYTELMGKLEWALYCAMNDWPNRLGALQWKEKSFVKRANIVSAITGISNPEMNRNIQGWAALWRVEVEMHFDFQDLIAELNV